MVILRYRNILTLFNRNMAKTTHYSIYPREKDSRWKGINLERDTDNVDVLIVGGGPAGLSTAIRLAQHSKKANKPIRICLIEKSSDFGGHMLSGACFDPKALNELLPDWKKMENHPLNTKVTDDKMYFLTKTASIPMPVPPWFPISNYGNYLISLGKFSKWLSSIAESLDVELYSGIGASEVLFDDKNRVIGVGTSDCGIKKDGSPKETFERGLALMAKVTIFAEGCRGSLSKDIIKKYKLESNCCPQSYAIGLKETWLIDSSKHKPGMTFHNTGWPLDKLTYGGSFLYHLNDGPMVSLGLIIGLNYENPYINTFNELQRMKTHPFYSSILKGGSRIGYGARALNEGGFQSIPKLIFPGGCLVGCSAGFVNNVKLKGIHTSMKSGMLAADAIANKLLKINNEADSEITMLDEYEELIRNSWVHKELYETRNVRRSFDSPLGLFGMLGFTGGLWSFTKGKESFTLKSYKRDNETLKNKKYCKKISYPKPDNKLTFDIMSSVALTNTNHDHDEPAHLTLLNDEIPENINLELYDGPEQRYCPANVYEYILNEKTGKKELQINAQNCIHCKTCDIKDPTQNINWVVPQNGGGPNYSGM